MVSRKLGLLAVLLLASGTLGGQVAEEGRVDLRLLRQWPGPDGAPLPFETLDEIAAFLSTADLVDYGQVSEGINAVRKVLLERDGVRMHAVFRDVKVFKRRIVIEGVTKLNFRDDAIFECAAYELALMLDFRYVPPAVPRQLKGINGTLQVWIEDSKMAKDVGDERRKADPWLWNMQRQVMAVFDNLIYNDDRNQGNILYSPPDGKLILIDHTRAFRASPELRAPQHVRYCERRLFERLKALRPEAVRERLRPYLSTTLIESLLKRRDKLVAHIEELIAEHGEKQVLFSFHGVEN